jgi:CO/xanthine dehydrogenase Mo-binding subunit
MAAYRCENKKAIGYAVYTNLVPGGGFRGYGASQSTFAIECAMDDLAKLLGLDPFVIRRKNMIRSDDWIESVWNDPSDIGFGSYGLDQCMDRGKGPRQWRWTTQARRRGLAGGYGCGHGHARLRPADRASLRC